MGLSGLEASSERERAKRTLWLVAATKLVCPLLPGRFGGLGGQR